MPFGDELFVRLRSARRDELEDLLSALELNPREFCKGTTEELAVPISEELRSAAAYAYEIGFKNAAERHSIPYPCHG